MQAARNTSDWWLSHWVTAAAATTANTTMTDAATADTRFYLSVYGYIAIASVACTGARSFLFALAGLTAAQRLHTWLLQRVVAAKVAFFDATPTGRSCRLGRETGGQAPPPYVCPFFFGVGRIINRFSSDVFGIDDSLPFILNILLAQVAFCPPAFLIG